MKSLTLDKIASVTLNCNLSKHVRLTSEIACKEGDVVAVRILTSKTTYDVLELPSGRFSRLKPGDVIAGALGHRRALQGYAGDLPKTLVPGDTIEILNMGGVLGHCTSINPDLGQPFRCEVLGQVLHFPFLGERVGLPANISQGLAPLDTVLEPLPAPIVAVVGTSMNAGKTHACTTLIQEFVRAGLRVAAAKCTGVSLRRDVLSMEDAGAEWIGVFTDLGVVTTTARNAPALARTLINRSRRREPDVVVLEMGDGLMGTYGVDAILADEPIRKSLGSVILCAQDPVGAWGGLQCLEQFYGLKASVVTGPATDNSAGVDLIRERFAAAAHNARTDPVGLADVVLASLGRPRRTAHDGR